MERTPQHRNRYTPPAQSTRGRDFRVIGRSTQAPSTPQTTPDYSPANTLPQGTFTEHANIPIQYPPNHQHHRIVATPAPPNPPYQPAPQRPQPSLQPTENTPQHYYQNNTFSTGAAPHHQESASGWNQQNTQNSPNEQGGFIVKLRNRVTRGVMSAKTYYSASPKRAALVAGSSLLVLSIIGWTLAMQSNSANDLLAKTPFGFLLINQGHTKGETVVVIEEKPTSEEVSSHKVPTSNPRYVTISRLGLFSRVLALESKDQGIELPENIYDVGWSTQSNTPVDPQGTQLYIGHAKGITKTDAAFSRLSELKVNDEIIVETGDGAKFTYIVMHTEKANVSSPNISRYYNSWVIGEPGLNLLTTSGVDPTKENPSENRYATFAIFSILKK